MKTQKNIKEIEINDVVFLFNEGKHIVDSFTKTSVRFKNLISNKIETINKNTFLKKHFYCNGVWSCIRKVRTINMDFI
jgi:hypothetical protein